MLQSGLALQGGSITEILLRFAARLLGLGIAAGAAAALVAMGYRWYVRERVPTGLGVLFGLSVVAVSLGTTGALGEVIGRDETVLAAGAVLPNLAAFAVGGFAALTGVRVGDHLGTDLFAATGGRDVNADVSEIVQTVGRVTSVRLPDDIDHIVGYDAVPEATRENLAGRRFLFPRRLTKAELRDRLVTRLKTDYGVGHVDLELDDGGVSYLAIGSRAAGIGPTLPPATNAIAVRADPAHAASAGDLVQVWETEPLRRVLTGELRGVAGEVVTVAIDAADTQKLDPSERYKLVTLPVQSRPDREFASLLRAADETMGTVHVEAGSELVGQTVGGLGVIVAAVTREGTAPETIPSRERALAAGDHVYAIATPDALRRLEAAAAGTGEPANPVAADEDDGEERSDESEGDEQSSVTGLSSDSGEVSIPDAESPAGDEPAGSSDGRGDSPPTDADSAGDDAALIGESDDDAEPTADTAAPEPADDADDEPDESADADDEPVEVWDPDERVGAATEETDGTDETSAGGSASAADDGSVADSEQSDGDDTERDGA
nr:TrkA C-terminal domain-containing protein [Halomicroarcula limicola]